VSPEGKSLRARIFRENVTDGGGLKPCYRDRKKYAIRQVLAWRILTVRGEVAERLKAAVC
jgi:hypothetical protein